MLQNDRKEMREIKKEIADRMLNPMYPKLDPMQVKTH